MGWTGCYNPGVKTMSELREILDEELTYGTRSTVVRSWLKRDRFYESFDSPSGNRKHYLHYAAVRDEYGDVFAVCTSANYDGSELVFRQDSEDVLPEHRGCPKIILRYLTDTYSEDALEWRHRVSGSSASLKIDYRRDEYTVF